MGKEKKNIRMWNVDHYCLYSSYSGNNLSRHLRNKHSDEKEMKELLEMDESLSLSAKRMELLRMRGDHAHNRSVLSCGSGTIVLSLRPTEDFDIDYYGPCPACLMDVILGNTAPPEDGAVPGIEAEEDIR